MNGSKTFCIRRLYMSSTLLDKLRVKPIPKNKSKIAVGLARNEPVALEPVKLGTLILDKRDKPKKDIGQIRKRLAKNHIVANTMIPKSEVEANKVVEPVAANGPNEFEEKIKQIEEDKPLIEKLIEETENVRDVMKDNVLNVDTEVKGENDNKGENDKNRNVKRIIKKPRLQKLKKTDPNTNAQNVHKGAIEKPKRKLRITQGPVALLRIGDEIMPNRLPEKKPDVLVRASNYYMNNREIFVNFITSLFRKYKDQIDSESSDVSCDKRQTGEYAAMSHQNLVRDYLNIYTPYRGLLLYHGLGSGKTCTSIGIAEGLKTHKPVLILTPASLRANFYKELKKCGDPIFRRNQFWEFINTKGNQQLVDTISKALSLPIEIIEKQGGAWLVNVKKPSNYSSLTAIEQRQLDEQINKMIESKYQFVNYNGLRKSHVQTMTSGFTKNPFDDKVIVIEEAHNFVSSIANKMTTKSSGSIALKVRLYEYLMGAKNCKIILLTGTPIINYPNELGIMFNILRGYIKTFVFKLNILSQRKVSEDSLKKLLSSISTVDYIEYSASRTTLTITKNPFGFVNVDKKGKYEGVVVGERGNIEDDDFIRIITSTLMKNDIEVAKGIQVKEFKSLPETLNDFKAYFIDEDGYSVKNINLFKRRILGLASYFRSAQEQLMPSYNKSVDFHVVKLPMSMYQFGVYEEARKQERKLEKRNAQKRLKKKDTNIYEETVSTYRIFSRAFCNFVFPNQEIERPLPIKGNDMQAVLEAEVDEDLLDAKSVDEKLRNPDGIYGAEDKEAIIAEQKRLNAAEYERRIQEAIVKLKENGHRFLTPEALETYSPKFLAILQHLTSVENENIGCNLIYSQFRTLEGIGIFKLVLEQNGFTHFKLKKSGSGIWSIDIPAGDFNKPMFALYTGTEDDEEKEIIRNIYNSEWNLVPQNIVQKLEEMGLNTNKLGETIKVLMITSSGAEGIDLKNVRYVHIVEPYWHPVRIEQVIGRARRICSHASLPEELRTVEVLLYLMEFSEEQLSDEVSIELRMRDKSKLDNSTPFTTDQAIYEIATIKEDVNSQLLTAVKEASVDCVVHSKSGSKEGLKCFTFGGVTADKFASTPSISAEENDAVAKVNIKKITWKAKNVTIDGIKYALREDTGEIFDLESFKANNPVLVGNLEKQGKKYKATWI